MLTFARKTCRELTGGTELLGFITEAADRSRFSPNILIGGVIEFNQFFDIATTIAISAPNASNALVNFWETALKDRTGNRTQSMRLCSMPPCDISGIRDPTWEMLSVAHYKLKYSVLNATDFDTIFQRPNLQNKASTEGYPALADRHRDLHAVYLNTRQKQDLLSARPCWIHRHRYIQLTLH